MVAVVDVQEYPSPYCSSGTDGTVRLVLLGLWRGYTDTNIYIIVHTKQGSTSA